MNAILCETGISFNIDAYNSIYGNAMLLKLQKKYIIRTVDRITKMPRITKLFRIINCGTFKIIEFPRFAYKQLQSNITSAMSPIKTIEFRLPIHTSVDNMNYIGESNPNQKIVVQYVVDKFNLARRLGFDNINMDVIIGLPGENISHIKKTCEEITKLNQDSLTIHGLSIKRGSRS